MTPSSPLPQLLPILTALILGGCMAITPTAPSSSNLAPDDAYGVQALSFGRDKLKGTTKTQGDFNLAHRYTVEIDGKPIAGIRGVLGPDARDILSFKDGDDSPVHLRPGRQKAGKITITKDWSSTSEFYTWRKAVMDGKVDRKSVSVIFHNDAGEEAGRLNFYQCWPTKWTGPNLNARNSAHATEQLEVAWETFELK